MKSTAAFLQRRPAEMFPIAGCAHTLKIGSFYHKKFGGPFDVCITPSQSAFLFPPGRPRKLGCGVFACAYQHRDPDKVVKITRDEADIAVLRRAQGLPRALKLFHARTLLSPTRWIARLDRNRPAPRAWAMIVERLRPLPKSRAWDDFLLSISRGTRSKRGAVSAQTVTKKCPVARTERCRVVAADITRALKDLRARGIALYDVHAGNIGLDKQGRWKILDFGAGGQKLAVRPAPLARP